MKICKVVGNITTSLQEPIYDGVKIMIVQPLGPDQKPQGETFLSCDFVQAGPGDLVLVETEGNAARQLFNNQNAPVHSVIVGIVDEVRMEMKK
ncbi:MAG: EutN/CcmL family microcompartment protein [Nitrospinae bacterium]|nr:EutN/CcmL family microcompartment protein [Nitrospinota bacterium]